MPLDPSYPPDRLANCMEDAEPVLLLSTVRHAELACSLSSSCASSAEVRHFTCCMPMVFPAPHMTGGRLL